MNNRYLFFYDSHRIKYLDSRKDYYHTDLKELNFTILDKGHTSHIRSIKSGSNSNVIAIVVDQTNA